MPLKSTAPRASLKPENASGGSRVPDGEYTIVQSRTGLNTYNGTVPEGVPAIIFNLQGENGDYENSWKAGDNEHLVPTEDGTGFTHPDGRSTPTIFHGGAANYLLKSLEAAGFEVQDVPEGVKQFEGLRVRLASKLIKLGQEKKDTPTPLVDKILGTAGKNAPAKLVKGATNSHGELDAAAVSLLKDVLGKAPGKQLPFENLAMKVWMAAGKTEHASVRQEIKSLITIDWVKGRKEFETDGEDVGLA